MTYRSGIEGEAPDRAGLLDDLLSMQGAIVLAADHDGTITFASSGTSGLLGVDADAIVGSVLGDLVHPDDLSRVSKPGAPQSVRLRHDSGEWRWFESLARVRAGELTLLLIDASERRARLQRSEERFRLMAEYGQDILVVIDADGTIRWASNATLRSLGLDPSVLVGESAFQLVHPDDLDRAVAELAAVRGDTASREPSVVRIRRSDGEYEQVEVVAADLLDEPAVAGIVLQMRVVTERVESRRRLEETARETARLTRVLGATSDLVAITSRTGKLLYVNDAFCDFFGVERDHLDRFRFEDLTPGWAQRVYADETIPALSADGLWQGEFAYFRDGVEVPMSALFIAHRDDNGSLEFVSSITRDISDRKALEERLAHQATHDDLTGLPNRALLLDHLWLALSRAARSGKTVGLLFIDLDGFKHVNDTYGHRAGDALLVQVAERLRSVMRPSDTVARFGGDEFVVLCDELDAADDAVHVAERVGGALRRAFTIEGDEHVVTGSIGIALAEGGGDSEVLLRNADVAMYRAKDAGRDRYEIFS